MSLNLKDPETVQLVHELAGRTGESLTDTVKIAVRERLERDNRRQNKEGLLEWLDQVTRETAAIMNDGRTSKELIEALYDPETGLPI